MKTGDMLIGYDEPNGHLCIGIVISHHRGKEYNMIWFEEGNKEPSDRFYEGFGDKDYLCNKYGYEYIEV